MKAPRTYLCANILVSVALTFTCAGTEVNEIASLAESDPIRLWELKDVPLDVSFYQLRLMYMHGAVTAEDWKRARQTGTEADYLRMQAAVERDPQRRTRQILLSKPELETFVSTKLARYSELLQDFYEKGYHDGSDDYLPMLEFCGRLPGDMAFRLLGTFMVSSPYRPIARDLDETLTSPADRALTALSTIAKSRLDEIIPSDIDGARKWWQENQNRFAKTDIAKANGSAISPSNSTVQNGGPNVPSNSSTPVSTTEKPQKRWATTAAIGCAMFILTCVLLFKKARSRQ